MNNTFTATVIGVLVGVVALGALAQPTQALSLADLQAQVQALLAQISVLQAQSGVSGSTSSGTVTASPVSSSGVCGVLTRNLYQGISGNDVMSLQEFLQSKGYFSAAPTGYYGPLTAAAVARWQVAEGVSAVGAFGPQSRARLQAWCGSSVPPSTSVQCKPVTYMPTLCSDGSAPQPVHDANGCLVSYTCPVANFTPPANCKAWNDGCNICSRTSPTAPAACTLRACYQFAAGKGYCTAYFSSTTQVPTISSFSGPTTLSVGQTGMWSLQASDPLNGTLSYHITWGDEQVMYPLASAANTAVTQTTTFTHAYATAGTYTITITVQNSAGQTATATATVQVGGGPVACTQEYLPVCGRPSGCANTCPSGTMCPMYCLLQTPVTYPNKCTLNAAGANYLHDGACTGAEQSY